MNEDKIFIAASGASLSRAEHLNGAWKVTNPLQGKRFNCLASDPLKPQRLFAGMQGDGVLVSEDAGNNWASSGLQESKVKSLAVSPHTPGTVFAGCNPISLYVSRDGGETWNELEGMRRARKWWWFSPAEPPSWTPYVIALTISPNDPKVIMAGIELGGVLRSEDGGLTWSNHRHGAVRDCHSLKFHTTNGEWVYQGGGTGMGAAFSRDGGKSWRQPKDRLAKKYGWMVAADPARPEVWYLSASPQPKLLRGEFEPPAHRDGYAHAHIYRSSAGAPWEQLSGGLPEPLNYMAYALVTDPDAPGHLYAGMSNGDVYHTTDYGDSWEQLPFNMGAIYSMIMI